MVRPSALGISRLMTRLPRFYIALLGLSIIVPCPSTAVAAPADDDYIAGYAAAVLQREFKLSGRSLQVKDAVITVGSEELADVDRARIIAVLSSIRGVMQVEVRETQPQPNTVQAASLPTGVLPGGELFKPLLADPRWPHFSAVYRYYINDRDLQDVVTVSFGETLSLFRGNVPSAGQWELGLQAAVFSVFDLDADSKDLINTDFFVAAFVAHRTGDFSALGRLFHQSSHVGDELLLRTRLQRINLSYESVDAKLSYDLPYGFRIYGGGGYLFDQEPSDLRPWSTQAGIEFRSPWPQQAGAIRPIAALDLQNREENDWSTDLSLRAGLQFDSVQVLGRNLQLMLEYFHGHSSDGQFYKRKVEYIGLGAHFHF